MTSVRVLADVDAIFERFHATASAPGMAYGVVIGGELIHSRGLGTLRDGEDAPPDADSRFRIASMTKSFTAAAVLRLRDAGVLSLDDEVAAWVPELARLRPWSSDTPPITIRALLTMSAGLPTDDPWGDRQQDLDHDAFARFLAAGPELAWPVGTHFEYANTGYAILGRVVTAAAGEPYRAVVEREILARLGMTSTGFDAGEDRARLAHGYVRRDEGWLEEPMAGDGAFAPMGGLFSTVRDLAPWVAQFAAAFPARDDDPAGPAGAARGSGGGRALPEILSRATRREMQQVQRAIPPELAWTSVAAPPRALVGGYGFGLFVALDVARGRIVSHGGGFPGFGSNMRWHPASGIGVVGLANGRYARMERPCREALELLVDREAAPVHRPAPWPATLDARTAIERLVEAWDDDLAARTFAMNVDLDEPLALRRAAIERLRAVHGRLRPDPSEPAISRSAADLTWWLAGDRGRVQVEILLDPERPPRVQWIELTSVPEPPAALTTLAERLVALLAGPGAAWPDDLPLGDDADRSAIDRELRAAEALYGPVTLGRPTAGDGDRAASWRVAGDRGELVLTLERDPATGVVAGVGLVPVTGESPAHLA